MKVTTLMKVLDKFGHAEYWIIYTRLAMLGKYLQGIEEKQCTTLQKSMKSYPTNQKKNEQCSRIQILRITIL